MRQNPWAGLLIIAWVVGATTLASYALIGASWPNGPIVMQLQLGSSGTLLDGSASWGASAENALATWNQYLWRSSFRVVRDSTAPIASLNGYNNVLWANDVYGSSFGQALAVTPFFYRGNTMVEADVIFSRAYSWNSYRGPHQPGLYDFYRVGLHELGHVLGLDHPDEHGQYHPAIMNAGDLNSDHLELDDIAGARALYGDTPAPAAPGAPRSFAGSAFDSTVSLTWLPPASGGSPSTYFIEAGSASGLANLANFSIGSTSTSFSTSNVAAGVYYVRVRASNAAGTSGPSNEATVVAGGGCAGAPSAPGGLRLVSVNGGTVALAWNAAAGNPTTYVVEAGSGPGAANLANSDLGSAATSLVANGVGRGAYYVRIRAKNACGAGAASNEIVVTVP